MECHGVVLRGLIGIASLLLVGFLFSIDRRRVNWGLIVRALVVQMLIGAVVLWVPLGARTMHALSSTVTQVLSYGDAGISFLFGGLAGPRMADLFGSGGFIFALRVLPQIIYVSALIALLQYWGIMHLLSRLIGGMFSKILGTSEIVSFSAALTIFLGQSEMPIALQSCLAGFTNEELFTVLCSGTSSIAGSVLAGYASLGIPMENLLAASAMAIPGGLLFAHLLMPGKRPDKTELASSDTHHHGAAEAVADGALNGARIAVAVGATLLAFVGLIALGDGILGLVGWSVPRALGVIMAPFAWLIGIPWAECAVAGDLLGQKIAFNEFVAYVSMSPMIHAHTLTARTITILSFALCGFSNISTMGILIGAFGSVAPERKGDIARMSARAVLAGTLSNALSAVIAGMFVAG